MVRDELMNAFEPSPSYNEMAAHDGMQCCHCERGSAGRFKIVLFLDGWADPLAACSWGCLARYALKQCGFMDDNGDPL